MSQPTSTIDNHATNMLLREAVEALLGQRPVAAHAFREIANVCELIPANRILRSQGCSGFVPFTIPSPFGNRWVGVVMLNLELQPVQLSAMCIHSGAMDTAPRPRCWWRRIEMKF